jgi:hypothetical protein
MTDAEKFAAVFRAAADGVFSHYPITASLYGVPQRYTSPAPGSQSMPAEERAMANAFAGVAALFEKIAEAERAP